MKILTVRQPWAFAIMHGGKNVENRTRNIAGSYRGPVAIHAAKNYKRDELWDTVNGLPREIADLLLRSASRNRVWPRFPSDQSLLAGMLTGQPVYRGAIVGVVDLVDVHWSGMECSRQSGPVCHEYAPCSPWGNAYEHHLVLENPRPLRSPIPFRGALGLRDLDLTTTYEVLAQTMTISEMGRMTR